MSLQGNCISPVYSPPSLRNMDTSFVKMVPFEESATPRIFKKSTAVLERSFIFKIKLLAFAEEIPTL
ncbi:hypothetical protein R83H12_02385 [Fibrobacteria bacterium R8-3-H12]